MCTLTGPPHALDLSGRTPSPAPPTHPRRGSPDPHGPSTPRSAPLEGDRRERRPPGPPSSPPGENDRSPSTPSSVQGSARRDGDTPTSEGVVRRRNFYRFGSSPDVKALGFMNPYAGGTPGLPFVSYHPLMSVFSQLQQQHTSAAAAAAAASAAAAAAAAVGSNRRSSFSALPFHHHHIPNMASVVDKHSPRSNCSPVSATFPFHASAGYTNPWSVTSDSHMTSYAAASNRKRVRRNTAESDLNDAKNEDACTTYSGGRDQTTSSGGQPITSKDADYFERRKKNNEAAKRSRDARRMKEEDTAMRAAYLEQENVRLKAELQIWRTESAKLHRLIYNRL